MSYFRLTNTPYYQAIMIGEKVYRMSWGTRVGISLVHVSSVSLLAVFRVAQVSRRVMAVSRAEVRLKLVPLAKHLTLSERW